MYRQQPSQLIRQRYSCRTYQQRPLRKQDLISLEDFIHGIEIGPNGNSPRFQILAASPYDQRDLPKLGTYGFIKDPAAFIAGAIIDQPGALVDFGFNMELVILKATELELGTCWLGGTFTKSRFADLMNLQTGESMPAVTSLGYPSDQQAWVDRVARIYAGADHRQPWEELFFTDNWRNALDPDQAGEYSEPLQSVRLGPSASNKQPWRVLQDKGQWHFYLERSPNYPSRIFGPLLNIADLQRVDLGIAMAHFALVVDEVGLKGKWRVDDPGIDWPGHNVEYITTWQAQDGVK